MARLRRENTQDDAEDSDPVTIPRRRVQRPAAASARQRRSSDGSHSEVPDIVGKRNGTATLVPKAQSAVKTKRTQVRLGGLSSSNSLTAGSIPEDLRKGSARKRGERRKSPIPEPEAPLLENENLDLGDEDEEIDVEESIWCGSIDELESSSGEELLSPRKLFALPRKNQNSSEKPRTDLTKQLQALSIFDDEDKVHSKKSAPKFKTLDTPRPTSSSDKENNGGIIRFSPPRPRNMQSKGPVERPSTPPPASPSKSKLQSPSKKAPRVPTPPLRPSLDAFWTADAINDWNDQYSPQKPLRSPRKLNLKPNFQETSPTTSPAKLSSPSKRTKAEITARKAFEESKVHLAESFLHELDQRITTGQISALAASTGGVHITWSKTLNSTAGRANWRRETTRSRSSPDPVHKHFASIELASKVIDDELRLLNVLAHEFCHLCNFMISGIKDQPHGRQFKEWGRKVTETFKERGVHVTTKHSYEIEYKYVWACGECEMEYKRHSKSIDPGRHRCGGCRGQLVQVKPVPRKPAVAGEGAKGAATGTPLNGYAAYVKEHFAPLKKGMPGASHKEVMEALGRKYRAEKAAGGEKMSSVAAIAKGLEDMKLGKGGGGSPLVIELD